jgi:hypothetical protein
MGSGPPHVNMVPERHRRPVAPCHAATVGMRRPRVRTGVVDVDVRVLQDVQLPAVRGHHVMIHTYRHAREACPGIGQGVVRLETVQLCLIRVEAARDVEFSVDHNGAHFRTPHAERRNLRPFRKILVLSVGIRVGSAPEKNEDRGYQEAGHGAPSWVRDTGGTRNGCIRNLPADRPRGKPSPEARQKT